MKQDRDPTDADATTHVEPYDRAYREGRDAALGGAERDTNRYFSREFDSAGVPESHEVWRSKYDAWRQGWQEGHTTLERSRGRTPAADGAVRVPDAGGQPGT